MNYEYALSRLLKSESTPKLGLERIENILCVLGNPERTFKSIHIAGTNGKGSTSAFANSLCGMNHRVGLYTSPHLLCARERIQIDSKLISEDLFCEAEAAVNSAADSASEKPTFFERITAMALWAFAKERVEIAIIEVGLGGRLDATNVLLPLISVITRVDLDHCDILGNTLEAIAIEKAGIIKPRTPIVTGWQEPGVLEVLYKVSKENGSRLIEISEPAPFTLGLAGAHQRRNAALALAAIKTAGISLSGPKIEEALAKTKWPARLEMVQHNSILIDGAHNPAGIRCLVNFLAMEQGPLVLVIGTTQGHDAEAMVSGLLPLKDRVTEVIVTRSRSPRAEDPAKLVRALASLAPTAVSPNVRSALERAQRASALTIITGSLYVAGEARGLFFDMPTDPELPFF